jgi:hypothetical protein
MESSCRKLLPGCWTEPVSDGGGDGSFGLQIVPSPSWPLEVVTPGPSPCRRWQDRPREMPRDVIKKKKAPAESCFQNAGLPPPVSDWRWELVVEIQIVPSPSCPSLLKPQAQALAVGGSIGRDTQGVKAPAESCFQVLDGPPVLMAVGTSFEIQMVPSPSWPN